ncbi:MAG: alpha/beta hydrolase [Akkermansiaceae bacterium]
MISRSHSSKYFIKTLCLITTLLTISQLSQAAEKENGYAASVPKPTLINVSYGENHRNFLDFWKAPSDTPTPLVIVIHGGGWNGGSKEWIDRFVDTEALLKAGISVAAINYRLIKHSKDLDPHVKGPMTDAARAVQFIRSKAKEWNINKSKIAATGGSAGACTSLWLAYHDDLADPKSDDPVSRESTRLTCVAVTRPQTTLDPKQMQQWITNSKYGGHAFGVKDFATFLAQRDSLLHKINEYSPYALLTKDDPATYMSFTKPPSKTKHEKDPTHSAIFGVHLQAKCDTLNVPCETVYPGAKNIKHPTVTEYLINKLRS